MKNPAYALLTAVRNEQEHIGRVLECVCAQTILPTVWVIVDTGSSDETVRIIKKYARKNHFILLSHMKKGRRRDFAVKVRALSQGYELARREDLDYLGIVDADVSFGPEYYERIVTRFQESPDVGISGGMCIDVESSGSERRVNGRVRGAIQTFRMQCLEDICGLLPLEAGGEDTVAEIMARMQGWRVECHPDLKVLHHRRTGTGECAIWRGRLRQGSCDYNLGYHPAFVMAKCAWRIAEKPYILGSLFRLAGYGWSAITTRERQVPPDVVRYLRREQTQRLKSFFALGPNRSRQAESRKSGGMLHQTDGSGSLVRDLKERAL